MAERMKTGLSANDLRAAFEDFQSAPNKQTKTIEYIVDDKGSTSELTQEMKNLNTELQKFAKLNQVQRGSLKWFGSQEKMINNLKKSWNEYATAVKNGLVDTNGNILVSKDDHGAYNQAKSVRSNLMASYNAANIALGVNNIDTSEISDQIRNEIQQVVSSLKLTDSFKNYSLSEEKLQPVLSLFESISKAATEAGMTVEEAFDKMGIAFKSAFEGAKVDGLNSIFDSATSAARDASEEAEDTTEQFREAAEQTEKAVEREAKAYEDLEQIRNRALNSRKRTHAFHDKDQFNQEMYFDENNNTAYTHWVEIEDDNLESYQKTLGKLQEMQEDALVWAKQYQNEYAKAYNSGDDAAADDYLNKMQEEIAYYNKYADAINYVQSQITDKALNFKPGEEWGEQEIANLIQLIQTLVQEVQKLTTAFGQVDDESGISPLLTQFSDLAVEISHVALEITGLKKSIGDMDFNLSINAGGNNAMVQNTLITNARRDALSLQKEYFAALDDYLNGGSNELRIFAGNSDLITKFYNVASQINSKSVNQSLYSYEKLVEIMKEAAELAGIDISPIADKYEPKIETANSEIEKFINTEEQAAKSAERIKDMFGNQTIDIPISTEQINEIIEALTELQNLLRNGLGLTELEDGHSISYLARINSAIDGITESFTELSNVINNIDFKRIQTAKNEIKDVLVFRGTNGDDPFTSNSTGMTFWHSTKSEARKYGTNGEDKTLYSGLLSISNPLEIDAGGSNYHDINYLGDGSDTISKTLIELTEHAEDCRQELLRLQEANENDMEAMQRAAQVGLDYSNTLKRIKEISEDDSNPYGKHSTDWFAEYAQKHGYDGLHVKNVIDNPDALTDGGNAGDVYVTFGRQQVKNIELLEKGNKKVLSSATGTQEAVLSASDAIDAEGKAAADAAKKKEEFAKANEKVAESAAKTSEAADKASESIKEEGNSAKSSKGDGKKDEPYNDEEMKRRAKLIEDEENKYQSNVGDSTLVSIQRMYDSHDNLVQSIITTLKTLQDEDGEIIEQMEHYQIRWDKKGNMAYGSRMTKDDYEKYQKKDEEYLRQMSEARETSEARRRQRENDIKIKQKDAEQKEKEQESKDKRQYLQNTDLQNQKNTQNNIKQYVAQINDYYNTVNKLQDVDLSSSTRSIDKLLTDSYDKSIAAKDAMQQLTQLFENGVIDADTFRSARTKYTNAIETGDENTDFANIVARYKELIKIRQELNALYKQKQDDPDIYSDAYNDKLDDQAQKLAEIAKLIDRIKENGGFTDNQTDILSRLEQQAEIQQKALNKKQNETVQEQSDKQQKASEDENKEQEASAKAAAEAEAQKNKQLQEQEKLVEQLVQAYEKLYAAEEKYIKSGSDKDSEKFLKARNNMESIFNKIDFDNITPENLNKLHNAAMSYSSKRARAKSQKVTNDEVSDYNANLKVYEELYKKQVNKALGKGIFDSQDAKQMQEIQAKLEEQMNKWGDAIKNGDTNLALVIADLKTIHEIQGEINKSSIDKVLGGIESKFASLNKQSSWRTDNWQAEVSRLEDNFDQIKKNAENIKISGDASDIEKMQKNVQKLLSSINEAQKSTEFRPIKLEFQQQMTSDVLKWMDQNKKAANEFKEELIDLQEQIKNVQSEADASRVKGTFADIQGKAAERGLLGKSLGDRFKDQFKNTMTSLSTYYLSFQDFVRYGREAINVVKEYDSALAEMRMVSQESLQSLKDYQVTTFETANMVGTTAVELQKSTAQWIRLGKSMDEASEAAKASAWLVNVSEFENIDEATTSLISMRQAFDDLSYEDFIDKLNGVGDNFSSSTDQLAFGMQNVSAVLKTAGNDIDQSLALLTAANDITQDMSKASMGVRTVALRIAGTEEAKQELEELGEDTSDFVVQTSSKVDSQVRAFTKTEKTPNGISVLDDNGRLRSTYDILLDISKVYQDIVDKDNEFGTNTSNALLELLAGKTRSNILASILQNPTLLEESYKQSQNSQGIGQKELDVYLDSVEAKMTKLQNRLQELAMITVDSQWLKDMLDLGTSVIGVINDIVKSVGSLNVAIGAITGIMMQKSGNGFLNFDKDTGFSSIFTRGIQKNKKEKDPNKLTAPERLFGYMDPRRAAKDAAKTAEAQTKAAANATKKAAEKFTNANGQRVPSAFVTHVDAEQIEKDATKNIQQANVEEIMKKTVQDTVGGEIPLDVMIDANVKGIATRDVSKGAAEVEQSFAPVFTTVQQTGEAMQQTGEAAQAAGAGMTQMATQAQTAGSIMQTLQNIGGTLLSTFANMAISMAASFLFTKAIEGLHNFLHQTEIAIERGKEAKEKIDSVFDESQAGKTTLQDIGKSILDTDGNISSEKSVDAIAKKLEKLKPGVHAFTNENLTLTNEDYQEYLDLNNKIAEQFPSLIQGWDDQGNAILTIGSNADDTKTKLLSLLEVQQMSANVEIGQSLGDMYDGVAANIQTAQTEIDRAENALKVLEKLEGTTSYEGNGIIRTSVGNIETLKDVMAYYGIYTSNNLSNFAGYEDTEIVPISFTGIEEAIDTYGDEFVGVLNALNERVDGETTATTQNALEASVRTNELFIEDQWASLSDTISKYLQTSKSFNGISENLQNAILSNITKIDTSKIGDKYKGDILGFIYGELIGPLNNLDQKYQIDIGNLFDIKTSKTTVDDYRQQIFGTLSTIFGDKAQEYADLLGFQGIIDQADKTTLTLISEFADRSEDIYGMSIEELETAQTLMGEYTYKSFDRLMADVIKRLTEAPKELGDGVLSDIFNNEEYKANAETYEKNLSSISTALQTLRTDGKLTAEAMRDLQESFPNLTDFSFESLQGAAQDELNKWIKDTSKNWKDLSPEGMKQLNTYVQNLAMSYGDLGVQAETAKDAIVESIYNGFRANGMGNTEAGLVYQAAEENYEQIMTKLQELHPEGINQEVVWMLALEDRFSDPAADIYSEYNDAVLQWEVQVDYNKTKDEIQRNVDLIQSRRSLIDAKGTSRENRGLDADNYAELLRLDDEEIKQWEDAVANTYDARMQAAIEARDKAYSEHDLPSWIKENAKVDWLKNNRSTVEKDTIDAQTNLINAQTARTQHILAQQEAPINRLSNSLKVLQDDASKTQNELTNLQNQGLHGTEEQYNMLIANANQQLTNLSLQKTMWQEIADIRKEEFGQDSTYYTDALAQVTEIESQMNDLRNNQQQWQLQPLTDQLTDYQNSYTTLQAEATKAQEEITKAETNHQKVSDSSYKKLISNGNKQIANMRDQQRALRELQIMVGRGTEQWYDYQSQIDSLDSSITDMQNSQVGWFESMTSVVSTNASQLSSALSSAFDEINSGTGLTVQTMTELQNQFSDLSGYDISNIFYESADGMMLNADACEVLVDAEYALQQANLEEVISTNEKILADENATASAREQADARIEAAQRELSMLQALYDEQKTQFSRLSQFQKAQSTENAGANYETMQGYLKTQNEQRQKGLTGTDEFRAYTEYFDQWGRDTLAAWDENKDKVKRYMTEDASGFVNFLNDLVSKGFAEKVDDAYNINMPNVEEAAAEMGMNVEWVRDMLGRAQDYGFTNNWVESELDGREKIKAETQEMVEAQLKYNEALANGAPQDVLDNLQEVIDMHSNNIQALQENIVSVSEREGKVTQEQIQNAVKNIETMNSMIDSVRKDKENGLIDEKTAVSEIATIGKNIENEAAKWSIPLDGFEVNKDKLNEQFDGWDAEISVTPTLNWDALGDEYADDTAAQKIQDGWEQNEESIAGHLETLRNTLADHTVEEISQINLDDGHIDSAELQSAEQALDGIKTAFGLSADEATRLVDILDKIGAFEGVGGKSYDIPEEVKVTPTAMPWDNVPEDVAQAIEDKAIYEENSKTYAPVTDAVDSAADKIVAAIDGSDDGSSGETNVTQEIQPMPSYNIGTTSTLPLKTPTSLIAPANTMSPQPTQPAQPQNGATTANLQLNDQDFNSKLEEDKKKLSDLETKPTVHKITGDVNGINNAITQAKTKLSQLNNQDTKVKVSAPKVDTSGAEAEVKQTQTSIQNLGGNSANPTIGANDQEFTTKSNQVLAKIKALNNKTATPKINADASNFNIQADQVLAKVIALGTKSATPKIDVDSTNALRKLQQIEAQALRAAQAISKASKYQGTANYTGTAFANGNWGTTKSEEALVGELGQELLVTPNGMYQTIGDHGAEFVDIPKGSIVFNHKQTEELLKNGKINSRGKALAGGNVPKSGPAYKDGETNQNATKSSGNSPYVDTKKITQANNKNTASTKRNTAAKDKNTKKTKKATTALDKFNKWLEKFVDWIDNRVDTLTKRIDRFTKQAELATNALGNIGKNSNVQEAMNTLADMNTYKNATLNTTTVTGTNDVTAKIAKSTSGGKKGTLLYDTMRGAVRYQKFADQIMNEAVKRGLFGKDKTKAKKQADSIKKLIQTGEIDIRKYNKKIRQVITSYEEWYNKSQELIDKTYELKQQFKDLEQQKLDNIAEQFETLKGYAESMQKISQAYIKLNTSNGQKAVNDERFRREYDSQMQQQNFVTGYLKAEIQATQKELSQAAQVFGINSNEYHEALTKFNEMQQALYESEEAYYQLRKEKAEMEFTAISQIMDRIKGVQNLFKANQSLNKARDNNNLYSGSEGPEVFINLNTGLLASNNGLIEQYKAQWDEAVKYMGENQLQIDNPEYQEYYKRAIEAETEIENLLANQEEIKKNIRDLRWKSFEDLQKLIKNTISDFDHLSDMIRDAEMFDWEFGINITDKGYANLALLAENIKNTKQQIKDYREALKRLDEEVENGNITQTEYNEKSREYVEIIQDAAKSVIGYEDSIIDMYKSQIQAETDLLQKNIQARKSALDAKKQ